MEQQYKEATRAEGGKDKFFSKWAVQRARAAGVQGIYVFICRDPAELKIEVDDQTLRRGFTAENRRQLAKDMLALLKQKKYDQALLDAVDFVASTLRKNLGAGRAEAPLSTRAAPPAGQPLARVGGSGILGWVCVGFAALAALWVVFAILRAITGFGSGGGYGRQGPGPGPGYGGGPGFGGGGYGGGGGGFLSSMLGGMFGAAAGNWISNSFFGGGHRSDWGGGSQAFGGPPADQGDNQSDQTGSGQFTSGDSGGSFDDTSGDSGGGGGDAGDSGGSFGDSGGDFGGGGDVGGGGDFGGGGGDSGGGDGGGF